MRSSSGLRCTDTRYDVGAFVANLARDVSTQYAAAPIG
jgi:hypothetical protein